MKIIVSTCIGNLVDSPTHDTGNRFSNTISPRIQSQNRNGSKYSVRDLDQSDLCKNLGKFGSLPCPFKETVENETGIAEKSSWYQANRQQKLGLVWRNRKKICQIIKDYFYLPFILLIILCPHYSTIVPRSPACV